MAASENLLEGAGSVSHAQAEEKARGEYGKYQVRTLSNVEHDYLEALKIIERGAQG